RRPVHLLPSFCPLIRRPVHLLHPFGPPLSSSRPPLPPFLPPHSLSRPPTPPIRASHSSFRPPYSRIRVPHSLLRSPTPPIRASPSSIRRVDSPPRTRFEGVDLRGKRPSQLPARRRDDLRSPGGRLRCNASPPGALVAMGSTLAATTDDAPNGRLRRHARRSFARASSDPARGHEPLLRPEPPQPERDGAPGPRTPA